MNPIIEDITVMDENSLDLSNPSNTPSHKKAKLPINKLNPNKTLNSKPIN